MVNENIPLVIPPVEIVAELESESNSEQKAQNQEYILSNLDKYIVDVHGNFFHIDEEMMVNEDKRFYVGQDAVKNHNEIKEKIVEMIINEKDSWEINDEENYVRRDCNKRTMSSSGFSPEQNEKIKKVLEGENGSQVTQRQQDELRGTLNMLIVVPSSPLEARHDRHDQWLGFNHDRDGRNGPYRSNVIVPDSSLIQILNNEDRDSVQRALDALDEDQDNSVPDLPIYSSHTQWIRHNSSRSYDLLSIDTHQDVSAQCSSRYEPAEPDMLESLDWLNEIVDELGID